MGQRGPTPKSAELRLLEGKRAHRPLPLTSPKYAFGVPERPKGMTAAAARPGTATSSNSPRWVCCARWMASHCVGYVRMSQCSRSSRLERGSWQARRGSERRRPAVRFLAAGSSNSP